MIKVSSNDVHSIRMNLLLFVYNVMQQGESNVGIWWYVNRSDEYYSELAWQIEGSAFHSHYFQVGKGKAVHDVYISVPVVVYIKTQTSSSALTEGPTPVVSIDATPC